MDMRRFTIFVILVCAALSAAAQQNKPLQTTRKIVEKNELVLMDVNALTDAELDTINVKKKLNINDYVMFGVQNGAGLSQVMWNPTQKQEMVFIPYNIGVTFTTYQKMFGFMPYFGFQAGAFYTREGYQFKLNENTDYIYKVE